MTGSDQREGSRAVHSDLSHRVCECLEISLPGIGEPLAQALEQQGNNRFQQIRPPADVTVERHRLHAQLLAKTAHGEALGTVGVDRGQGGLDDSRAV